MSAHSETLVHLYGVRNSEPRIASVEGSPIIAIRPVPTSRERIEYVIREFGGVVCSGDVAVLDLVYGPTTAGGLWVPVSGDSLFEVNASAVSRTGGRTLASILCTLGSPATRDLDEDVVARLSTPPGQPIPPSTVLAIVAYGVGAPVSVMGEISWREVL